MKVFRLILPPLDLGQNEVDFAPNAEPEGLRCDFCSTTSHRRPFRVMVPDNTPEPDEWKTTPRDGQGKKIPGEKILCAVCYETGLAAAIPDLRPSDVETRLRLAWGLNELLDRVGRPIVQEFKVGPSQDVFEIRAKRVREFDELAIEDARETAPEGETDTAFWARVEAVRPGIVDRRNPFVRAFDQVGDAPSKDRLPGESVEEHLARLDRDFPEIKARMDDLEARNPGFRARRLEAARNLDRMAKEVIAEHRKAVEDSLWKPESPFLVAATIVFAILFASLVLNRCFPVE